jgi:hypothetical protein
MVSSLSSRLLAGRAECASRGSSIDNGSPQQKIIIAGSVKTKRTLNNEKNENNVSGYSADREGPSSCPPVVSINLHSKSKSSTRVDALKCPKRRKKNEIQFAATTVKSDLARADKEFKTLQQHLEDPSILGDKNFRFKDKVKLLYSKDVSTSLVPPSNIGKNTTTRDYASLISAASSHYPCKSTQVSDIKSFEQNLPSGQNEWSEPSTSSISDTFSDSGSDNTNNQSSTLTPLLEDSLEPTTKKRKKNEKPNDAAVDSTDSMSSVSNAITMTKILQLSKTARVVVNSFAPYSVVHFNAAFHRLSGQCANDTVIGKSFFSLLDPEANQSQEKMSLSSFMISSSKGDDPKLYLSPMISDRGTSGKATDPVKCTIRVSPVLKQKVEVQDQTKVGYFVIEFVPYGKEFDETSLTNASHSSFSKTNTPMGVVA